MSASPPGSTGIPGLDAHLLSNASHHRPSSSSSLNRGDVLEIQGPAASGKTQLLYHLVMKCILPHEVFLTHSGDPSSHLSRLIYIGGWEKAAIVMDSDGRWSMRRLQHLLLKRLEYLFPQNREKYEPQLEDLVSESLRRVHIFRPTSMFSLAATLLRLPTYLSERLPDYEMALLVIDSISAFYWVDRYNLEQQQRSSDKKDKEISHPLGHVLMAIQELRLKYGQVTVMTNWGLIPAARSNATQTQEGTQEVHASTSPFYRQHLHPFPAPFELPARILTNAHLYPPISYHITLTPIPIPCIPSRIPTLEDAKEANTEREALLKKREKVGIIRRIEGGHTGTFTYRVLDDEIIG